MRIAPVLLLVCACEVDVAPPRSVGQDLVTSPGDEPVLFGFPVATPASISTRVGVDHDPVDGTGLAGDAMCTDYLGRPFPNCYDQHDGSDYILDGGFTAMDAGSAVVIAAADGVVIETEDGHYDRCHSDLEYGGVSCDGNDGIANSVVVEHPDGLVTRYWHLMRDSVAVSVGDEVACGQRLGVIGSSGLSSMPHLHFEVQLDGVTIDPYAGPWSQEESYWAEQGAAEGLPGPGCTQ